MGKVLQRFHKEISCTSQCLGPCSAAFWGSTVLIIGAVLILLSYVGPIVTNRQLELGIRENIIWQPNSAEEVFRKFSGRSRSGIGYMKFYFWNITNTEDVLNGQKPKLEQIGPFCYNKYVTKHNELFDLQGNVHYNQYTHYTQQLYNPGCVDENSVITTPNMALIGILNGLQGLPIPGFVKDIVSGIISDMDGQLFMQRTVRELLWGYTDPILKYIDERFGDVYPSLRGLEHVELVHNMSSLEEALHKPQDIQNTGLLNISNVMQYVKWDNATQVTSWNNTIEQITGTDAYQFKPKITKHTVLSVWTADLYRVAEFKYLKTVQWQGVELYRFIPSEKLFQVNPSYDQNIYGLVNITGPKAAGPTGNPEKSPGPQVLVSLPHFCKVDEDIAKLVQGMNCTGAENQLYLDIEPTTGSTMYALIRLQMNTHIAPRWVFDLHAQDVILPVFWTEQIGHAEQYQIDEFKNGVLFAQSVITWFNRGFVAGIVVAGFSSLIFGWMLYGNYVCCCYGVKKREKKKRCESCESQLEQGGDFSSVNGDIESSEDLTTQLLFKPQHVRKCSVQPQTPSESEEERMSHLE